MGRVLTPATTLAPILAALLVAAGCQEPPGQAVDAAAPSIPDSAVPDAGLPDLGLDHARTQLDLAIEERFFSEDACELRPEEACIEAPGMRRLLRFSVETPNVGGSDLVLGTPSLDNPDFEYSSCHGHYHFEGYAEYRLLDAQGTSLARGHKQSFCLVDSIRYQDTDPSVPATARFNCTNQGIQRGWADVYESKVPCQHIDITDLDQGPVLLEVEVNPQMRLQEVDYSNNTIQIQIDINDPALATPTETCPPAPDRALTRRSRECGWSMAQTMECVPGSRVRLGCASACALGTCTGDPMLRVCDDSGGTDPNCTHAASLSSADNECGPCPRAIVDCPQSGSIDIYTAAKNPADPYTCELAMDPLP